MKKTLSLLLTICLFLITFSSVFSLIGCKDKQTDNSGCKWNNMQIKNFANYTALGAASLEQKEENLSGKSSTIQVYADETEEGDSDVKLVGITNSGECEEITFVDSEGNEITQNVHLVYFTPNTRYSFLFYSDEDNVKYKGSADINQVEISNRFCFDNNKIEIIVNDYSIEEKFYYGFILDNENGKIYDIRDVIDTVNNLHETKEANIYFSIRILNYDEDLDNIVFLSRWNAERELGYSVFKINFNSDDMSITGMMNNTQVKNFVGENCYYDYFQFDCFGNIFYTQKIDKTFSNGSKFQKSDGSFGTLEVLNNQKCFIAINQILYKLEYNNVYNEEKHTSEYICTKKWYLNEEGNFIEIDNTVEVIPYYGNGSDYNGNFVSRPVYIKLINDGYMGVYANEKRWNVLEIDGYYQGIELEVAEMGKEPNTIPTVKNFMIMTIRDSTFRQTDTEKIKNTIYGLEYYNGYVYGEFNGKFTCFSIEDGSQKDLFSNYDVKNIKYDKLQNILTFKAIDRSTLLEVDGFINSNNEVQIGEFDYSVIGAKKVYVIKPLN